MVEGHGCILKDIDGKEYIDGLAGLWLVNVGHGRKEIGEAMAAQAGTLAYARFHTNDDRAGDSTRHAPCRAYAWRSLYRVFCSEGSDGRSAIKIARQYQYLAGFPKRFKIIGRRGSYHGATYGAMSVSGTRQMTEPYYSPFMNGAHLHVAPPYCYRCDYRHTYPACDVYCVDAEQLIEHEGPQTVAGGAGISASGGIAIPPPIFTAPAPDL